MNKGMNIDADPTYQSGINQFTPMILKSYFNAPRHNPQVKRRYPKWLFEQN